MTGTSVALLCGGHARRFGCEKALEPLGDRTMVDWVVGRLSGLTDDVFVQLSPGATAPEGVRAVRDEAPGCGPLSGIHGALVNALHERVFVCAVDMPGVDPRLPALLVGQGPADAVVPRWSNGWLEPLCALYGRSALPVVEEHVRLGRPRIRDLLDALPRVHHLDIEPQVAQGSLSGDCFVNINSRDELERFLGAGHLSQGGRA